MEFRVPYSSRVSSKRRKNLFAAAIEFFTLVTAVFLFGAIQTGAVFAQPAPQGIIGVGDAALTGFSGVVLPPSPLPPGILPADKTYIDLKGPSARLVDLQNMGGPPAAQLVNPPKPLTVTAGQTGQVYAVALDNTLPPNIFVAATSSYGLPIVVPDADGDGRPDRVRQGAPNAAFMPGLWGPAAQGGGPGSIWRIDGVTGAVTLFANVALDGVPNSGPALGGLTFDPSTNQLFVADRDTGMIHRFTLDGMERGRYDHGVTGRTAAGMPPVPFDPANRLNIASPAFNSENPATWAFTPPERRIYGLGVRGGRLFYAVTGGLSIWSVSILPDGSFGNDTVVEVRVPPALAPTEIAKITFDDQGRMILGERGVPVGSYDFSVLAQESVSRVLRYARIVPAPGQPPVWQPVPDEYAIGFAAQNRNANGGVAVGYGYDAKGQLNRNSCGGTLWSTGEQLRQSADPAMLAQLAAGGPTNVNGLQGNAIELVLPQNVPPQQSYFIDYDDAIDSPASRGYMGDIAIPRICGQGEGFGWLGGPYWLPPGYLPPDFGWPLPPPPLPPGDAANLRIDKSALPEECSPWGGGWSCWFRVRVTSTGPGPYVGPILVSDSLPAAPAGAVMAFGLPPWICGPAGLAEYQCLYPATVLNPGASVDLDVYAWVPNAFPHCNLVNAAEILWAPGGDFNPADDFASADAVIPAKGCPSGEKETNLQITKEWLSCYDIAGPQHRCAYRVYVTNTGPGVYNDHIHFTDEIPAGTTAIFSSPVANPFTCAGGPPIYTCQSNSPVVLNPTEQTFVTVRINVPDAQAPKLSCQVRNEVKITQPLGGPQNTNAADDVAEATGILPNKLCPIILPITNLRLQKTEDDGICSPVAGGWQCNFTVRVTNTGAIAFNGEIRVSDILDFATPTTKGSVTSADPWKCWTPAIPAWDCTLEKANLAPGQFTQFNLELIYPLSHDKCSVSNWADILKPGSPTLSNINPADDSDSASAQFAPVITLGGEFYCAAAAVKDPDDCPPNTIRNRATGQCLPFSFPPPLPPPPTCPPGMRHDSSTSRCIKPPAVCPPGTRHNPNTSACIGITLPIPPPICPTGMRHDRATSRCILIIPTCPSGQRHDPQTSRCRPILPLCPPGQTHLSVNSRCITPPPPKPLCPPGQNHVSANSRCVTPPPPKPLCPPGQNHVRANSRCVTPPPPKPTCPQGQNHVRANSRCVTPPPPKSTCPPGQNHISTNSRCIGQLPPKQLCPPGQNHVSANSRCIGQQPPKQLCPPGQNHVSANSRCLGQQPPATLKINPQLLQPSRPTIR